MKDAVFWTLIGMLIFWIILKAIGVIQSPVYLELFPTSVIVGLFIYLYKDLKSSHRELRKELTEKIDKKNETVMKKLENIISIFDKQTGKTELLIEMSKQLIRKKG